MKKNKSRKLTLNRETVVHLHEIAGGQNLTTFTPILQSRFPCTNEISVCNYCTTPLDSCPVVGTVA